MVLLFCLMSGILLILGCEGCGWRGVIKRVWIMGYGVVEVCSAKDWGRFGRFERGGGGGGSGGVCEDKTGEEKGSEGWRMEDGGERE